MAISLIAGLGNPGTLYKNTRHNLGYIIVEAFSKYLGGSPIWESSKTLGASIAKLSYNDFSLKLIKPQTFMNNSGQCLKRICRYYKVKSEEMVIIYDDYGLDFGRVKLSIGGGVGGHNGIDDLVQHFPGNDFIRFRVGIGGYKAHEAMALKDYVLGNFSEDENSVLTTQMNEYINDLKFLIGEGLIKAMQIINQKTKR